MTATAGTAEDIPEALDLGEDPVTAIMTRIGEGAYIPRELGRDIACALTEPESIPQVAAALAEQPECQQVLAHILLELLPSEHLDAEPAFRHLNEVRRTHGGPLEGPHAAAIADMASDGLADEDISMKRQWREERNLCRQQVRKPDLSELVEHAAENSRVARVAADLIIRENRLADLLAATPDPPSALRIELGRKNMLQHQNPPAALRGQPPALLAARLWQATESGQGTRWIHNIHPVLWIVGHRADRRGEQDTHHPQDCDPDTLELLLLLPDIWLATAGGASEQSRQNMQALLQKTAPGPEGAIAGRLLTGWQGSLADLLQTARRVAA